MLRKTSLYDEFFYRRNDSNLINIVQYNTRVNKRVQHQCVEYDLTRHIRTCIVYISKIISGLCGDYPGPCVPRNPRGDLDPAAWLTPVYPPLYLPLISLASGHDSLGRESPWRGSLQYGGSPACGYQRLMVLVMLIVMALLLFYGWCCWSPIFLLLLRCCCCWSCCYYCLLLLSLLFCIDSSLILLLLRCCCRMWWYYCCCYCYCCCCWCWWFLVILLLLHCCCWRCSYYNVAAVVSCCCWCSLLSCCCGAAVVAIVAVYYCCCCVVSASVVAATAALGSWSIAVAPSLRKRDTWWRHLYSYVPVSKCNGLSMLPIAPRGSFITWQNKDWSTKITRPP